MQAMVERAHKAGFQIAAHAIGPRAIEPLLSAMEKTLAEDPEVTPSNQNPYRHRIEHFEFPTPDQMKRTVQAGIPVVVQAGWTWMDTRYQQSYAFRLTDDQIAGQVALRTIADLGGIICGSSDSPIQDPDPFIQIQGMIDFPVEGQSLTRWEAVRAYTANAAWAGFQEEEKGTLEPGKRADFIVLDKDIFDESVFIPAIKVKGVYTGGHIVKPVNYTLLTILPKLLWGKKKRI